MRKVSLEWSRASNDCIQRVCTLFPDNFIGVCQLPQTPGVSPENCIDELKRCVNELGFVGCNLNPDPSGGHWTAPPLDRPPLVQVLREAGRAERAGHDPCQRVVQSDVPHDGRALHQRRHDRVHAVHHRRSVQGFSDSCRLIIPHGGGAVPYHWGRYRGLAQNLNRPPLDEMMRNNVFFDTCVYHQPGIDLLTKLVPADNILFASEMLGAVKGDDPTTGYPYDDTKRYIDATRSRATPTSRRSSRATRARSFRASRRSSTRRSPRSR